jgi:hypothetical protein
MVALEFLPSEHGVNQKPARNLPQVLFLWLCHKPTSDVVVGDDLTTVRRTLLLARTACARILNDDRVWLLF